MSLILPSNLPILVVYASVGNTSILSSLGARLLINMKEAGEKGLNERMSTCISRYTISKMDFALAPAQTSEVHEEEYARGMDEEIETVRVEV